MVIIFRYVLVITCFILVLITGITPQVTVSAMVNDMFDDEKQIEDQEEDNQPVNNNQDNETSIDSPSLFASFIKLVVALVIIVGLIVVISKFLKRKNSFFKKHQVIENYGGITVASNKSIQTIKIADRFFVIGVGENIELLMEITDQDTIDKLLQQKIETTTSIKNITNKLTGNRNTKSGEDKENFEMLFNKELNEMTDKRRNEYKKMIKKNDNNDH